MDSTLVAGNKSKILPVIFDVIAITFLYLVPTLSHLTGIPFYMAEPMRILMILALVHTRKENAYFLALTLPLFSWLVGGHPVGLKAVIMMAELTVNVWLYFAFANKISNKFLLMFSSILLSKILYYGLKIAIVSFGLLKMDIISTPILIQLAVIIMLSLYAIIPSHFSKSK